MKCLNLCYPRGENCIASDCRVAPIHTIHSKLGRLVSGSETPPCRLNLAERINNINGLKTARLGGLCDNNDGNGFQTARQANKLAKRTSHLFVMTAC